MTASKITPVRAGGAAVRKSSGRKTAKGRAITGKAIAAKPVASAVITNEGAGRKKGACQTRCARWNGRRRALFLAALTETANVRRSAKAAGMSLAAAYALKRRDPTFAGAWKEALEIGYSEVEMALLRESLNGSERIETVKEGENKTLKYIKTVRSFNFSVAVRLFMAHRAEVLAFRLARGDEAPDTGSIEETEHYLALIRARLGETDDETAGDDDTGSRGAPVAIASPALTDAPEPGGGHGEADAGENR